MCIILFDFLTYSKMFKNNSTAFHLPHHCFSPSDIRCMVYANNFKTLLLFWNPAFSSARHQVHCVELELAVRCFLTPSHRHLHLHLFPCPQCGAGDASVSGTHLLSCTSLTHSLTKHLPHIKEHEEFMCVSQLVTENLQRNHRNQNVNGHRCLW